MSPTAAPVRRRSTLAQRRGLQVGLVVLVGLLGVIAWSVERGGDDDTSPRALVEDPGVEHVHGLGLNPADGSLYVATHTGTFRIPEGGRAQRIGDSFQDTMGFTVVGPDTFLGSGHPDVAGMRAGQPGLLGLIESEDAGTSWTNLSLSGEVDFHALSYAHDRVYGWDSTSGGFMVSEDRVHWDERSTFDLFGFAVDPDDPDHLVAATQGGTSTSSDGGRTWSEPTTPAITAIAWAPHAGLWGIEPGGTVQRSVDGGATWTAVGMLAGEPQALFATDEALWAAAHDANQRTGIYRSANDGATWQLRYEDPA